MVKHIVLFKLGPFATAEERLTSLANIKQALLNLKGKVEVLKAIEVGINSNPAEQFDLSLITEFDSMEHLAEYAQHPDHVAVAKNLIGPLKQDRACVDYII
ncbi:MAG: Dabb family protein [Bacteroidales bacterium]